MRWADANNSGGEAGRIGLPFHFDGLAGLQGLIRGQNEGEVTPPVSPVHLRGAPHPRGSHELSEHGAVSPPVPSQEEPEPLVPTASEPDELPSVMHEEGPFTAREGRPLKTGDSGATMSSPRVARTMTWTGWSPCAGRAMSARTPRLLRVASW